MIGTMPKITISSTAGTAKAQPATWSDCSQFIRAPASRRRDAHRRPIARPAPPGTRRPSRRPRSGVLRGRPCPAARSRSPGRAPCETRGYCGICGRAFSTFSRFVGERPRARVLRVELREPRHLLDRRRAWAGAPVASESFSSWSGAVNHFRKSQAASTRCGPLSKITQLSGPAIVWWLPPGSNDGMTCTPYFTSGKLDRSHGPVIIMPMLPELKSFSLLPASGWKSR